MKISLFSLLMASVTASLSCTTESRDNYLKHVGYITDTTYAKSIGAFTGQEAMAGGYVFQYGTGFIIGEDDSKYYGLTNAHVWDQCQQISNDGSCLMVFAENGDQTEWAHFHAAALLDTGGEHVYIFSDSLFDGGGPGAEVDFAAFTIEKSSNPDFELIPLPVYKGYLGTEPLHTDVYGYPGGIIRQGETQYRATLVRSSGVGFVSGPTSDEAISMNGGQSMDPENILIFTNHIRSGNSGSPIFANIGDQMVVVGIAAAGLPAEAQSVYADSQRSAAKDRMGSFGRGWPIHLLHDKYFHEQFWDTINLVSETQIFTQVLDLSDSIEEASYSKEILDGELSYIFELNLNRSINTDQLFINGIPFKYLMDSNYDDNKLVLAVPANETVDSYPELTIEYMTNSDTFFSTCYANDFDLSDSKVKCFARYNNEHRYQLTVD